MTLISHGMDCMRSAEHELASLQDEIDKLLGRLHSLAETSNPEDDCDVQLSLFKSLETHLHHLEILLVSCRQAIRDIAARIHMIFNLVVPSYWPTDCTPPSL